MHIVLHSIRLYFHHLGALFALVQLLHSSLRYFSTLLQQHIGFLPNVQCHIILPFHTVHRILKAIPKWFAIHFSSELADSQGKPKNTGVGILQWIFLTQEQNRGLLHCRQILYQLSYQERPSSGPHFVKILHHDPFLLCGPTRHGSQFHCIRQGLDPCDQFDQFSVIVVFILSALTDMVILRTAFLIRDMSTFTKDRLCQSPFKTCWVKSSGASMCTIFQEYVILSLHSTD